MLQCTRTFQVSTTCHDGVKVATIAKVIDDCRDDEGVSITQALLSTSIRTTTIARDDEGRVFRLHSANCLIGNPELVLLDDVCTIAISISTRIDLFGHNLFTPEFNIFSSCRGDDCLIVSCPNCSMFDRERRFTIHTEGNIITRVIKDDWSSECCAIQSSALSDSDFVDVTSERFAIVPRSTDLECIICIIVVVGVIRTNLCTIHEQFRDIRCTRHSDVIPSISSRDSTRCSDMITSTSTISQ